MALKMKLPSLGGRYLNLASGVGDSEAEKAFKATLVLISTANLRGDTVNTASRMETHGVPDEIQVTAGVYRRLHGAYVLRPRGRIEVRGKGSMDTYLLDGRLPE